MSSFNTELKTTMQDHGEVHAIVDIDIPDEITDDGHLDLRNGTTTVFDDHVRIDTHDDPVYVRLDSIAMFYPPGGA